MEEENEYADLDAIGVESVSEESKEGSAVEGEGNKVEVGIDSASAGTSDSTVNTSLQNAEVSKDKSEDEEDDMKGVPPGLLRRFSKMTRDKYDLMNTIKELKDEVERLKPKKADGNPTRQDFIAAGKTEDDYFNYLAEKKGAEIAERNRIQAEAIEIDRKYREREELARKAILDYDIYAEEARDIGATREENEFVMKSDVGPDIVYALGKMKGCKKGFLDAPNKMEYLKKLEDFLHKAKAGQLKNSSPSVNQPAAAQMQKQTAQEIREPMELKNNSSGTRKRLDPSTCSMDEWMEQDD